MNENQGQYQEAFDENRKRFSKEHLREVADSIDRKIRNITGEPEIPESEAGGEARTEPSTVGSTKLDEIMGEIRMMGHVVKEYAKGNYSNVPWGIIAAIGGALLYFINPFDIMPDFIPGLGYLDDISVIAIALNFIGKDVDKYRLWKREQKSKPQVEEEQPEVINMDWRDEE